VSDGPYYVDPSCDGWTSPNLISGLMKSPATEKQHPLERQATIVLAWLLDRSEVLSRAVLSRFFADDEVALEAVAEAERIGTRAWGTLRPVDGLTGHLYPDLTISGSARTFELIVEVKVDANLHGWPIVDGVLLQPDAYIRSWLANYAAESEATVRRIGTLTKSRPGVSLDPQFAPYRAADLRWSDVRSLLNDLSAQGSLEPNVKAVSDDALVAIEEVLLVKPTSAPCPQDLTPELAWACSFVRELALRLQTLLPSGTIKTAPRYVPSANYVGGNVYFSTPAGERCLWVWATPPGWPYHAGDGEMAVWLGEQTDKGRWPPELLARAAAAGFSVVEPKTPGIGLRRPWPLAELQRMGEETALHVLVAEAEAIFL
jgi:hypothetical protein